ncbi:hypothetical protein [Streptomyces humi]|uniref:hypothetical protein n=1 Tax=Streptomyces humi TaxID=1428620 RepID=UPI001F0B46BE|nr:hypothetical protein [Streptomyces humi]
MSPRTPRPTAEPIATTGTAHAGRRVRRAAALPMPDGASMTPLAPADPLGAGNDESTLRSLSSVLAASRTVPSEPESDPAAWRPRGRDEAGQEPAAGAEGAAAPAGPPQRRSGSGRLTSKVAERPFLVAAAVAGAVVVATPFLTSNAKDHTTTYEGLGKADPVAVEGGGAPDRHPDAYPSEMPLQDSATGGETTSADNLLDPDAGAWHGAGGAAAAGDTGTASDSAQVPGVLAADGSGSGADTPAPGTAVAAADTAGHPTAAAAAKGATAKEADAPGPAAASTKTTDPTDAAKTPAKTPVKTPAKTPVKTTVMAAAKPTTPTTTKSDTTTDTAPVAARAASTAATGAATTTKPTAAGEALTPVDGDASAPSSADSTRASSSSATDTTATDTTATDTKAADTTATDTKTTDTKATDTKAAGGTAAAVGASAGSAAASDQTTKADPAPQWSTKVFTSAFTLRSGESVNSDRMRITMRASGDLVISDENGTVRWSSHTTGENNYATFKADGELVVRSAYQQTLWSSRTGGHSGAELVIQNDGNVTILSSGDQTLWAAGTQH